MNPWERDVRLFHKTFGAPAPETLQSLEDYRGELRIKLMQEELDEFKEAWEARDQAEMVDAIVDLIYVSIGASIEMGVYLSDFWNEVQKTNMEKLWPDGRGHYSPQGKIQKPPGWKPPDINRLLEEARRIATPSIHKGEDLGIVPSNPMPPPGAKIWIGTLQLSAEAVAAARQWPGQDEQNKEDTPRLGSPCFRCSKQGLGKTGFFVMFAKVWCSLECCEADISLMIDSKQKTIDSQREALKILTYSSKQT